jgi:hypothetical protein
MFLLLAQSLMILMPENCSVAREVCLSKSRHFPRNIRRSQIGLNSSPKDLLSGLPGTALSFPKTGCKSNGY